MGKTRTAEGRVRVMATLDEGLVERLDKLAKRRSLSRSETMQWVLGKWVDDAEWVQDVEEERAELEREIARVQKEKKLPPGKTWDSDDVELNELLTRYRESLNRLDEWGKPQKFFVNLTESSVVIGEMQRPGEGKCGEAGEGDA